MLKILNNIKDNLENTDLSVVALALYLEFNDTYFSQFNTNVNQPGLLTIDKIGEILEIDNKQLITKIPRGNTGLANALQVEYKRLLDSGLTKKSSSVDSEGNSISVNNPKMVEALQEFVKKYKLENPNPLKLTLTYFDKLFKEIKPSERKGLRYFICKAPPVEDILHFEYLVVDMKLRDDKKFIARFARKADAEKYIRMMLNIFE